jgi:putative phosphoribosyl transferase
MIFKDRRDAGVALVQSMKSSRDWAGAIVLGLPRGGVPVAFEVARILSLPLDVLVVRKLGVPGFEELAMGAVASGGTLVVNESVVREFEISRELLESRAQEEQVEIERREGLYRDGRPPAQIDGRVAILVDDGLATGASMLAAVRALRPRAREVIVAVPVAAERTCSELSREVDQIFCVIKPRSFMAVGMFYRNFNATSDEEVRHLLAHSHEIINAA